MSLTQLSREVFEMSFQIYLRPIALLQRVLPFHTRPNPGPFIVHTKRVLCKCGKLGDNRLPSSSQGNE